MSKKPVFLITLVVALFAAAVILSFLYFEQQFELARTKDALDEAEQRYSALEADLDRLNEELQELQANYELLLEEARRNEPGNSQPGRNPGGSFPGGSGPTAYLTIDDGPSRNTLEVLKILKAYRVPATFFVTGNNVSGESGIYRRILAEGHALGNHTDSHNFEQIYASVDAFMEDFRRFEDFLYRETGVRTEMMRFPGGSSSQMAQDVSGYNIIVDDLIAAVTGAGYDYFDWNVYSGDGNTSLPAETLIANVKQSTERQGGGDIVVLIHDGRNNQATVEALPEIIEYLRSKNYEFALLHKGAINVKHR